MKFLIFWSIWSQFLQVFESFTNWSQALIWWTEFEFRFEVQVFSLEKGPLNCSVFGGVEFSIHCKTWSNFW